MSAALVALYRSSHARHTYHTYVVAGEGLRSGAGAVQPPAQGSRPHPASHLLQAEHVSINECWPFSCTQPSELYVAATRSPTVANAITAPKFCKSQLY